MNPREQNSKAEKTVTKPTELFKFLIEYLPHKSRNNIKTLLKDKQIIVNGEVVSQFNHPLLPGYIVEIRQTKISEVKDFKGISILYEDEYLIVIDKHAGMLSIAASNEHDLTAYKMLSEHVKKSDKENKIFVVHRLDRETSGVMMYAKSEKVQQLLQESWHTTVTERSYIAVTEGEIKKTEGTITSYLKENSVMKVFSSQYPDQGEKAITHYQLLKISKGYSLVKVILETGKKNQIRVHLQDIGHPIVGDKKYGSKVNPIGRVGLHAWVLAFIHPISGEVLRFETTIPRKFSRLFNKI